MPRIALVLFSLLALVQGGDAAEPMRATFTIKAQAEGAGATLEAQYRVETVGGKATITYPGKSRNITKEGKTSLRIRPGIDPLTKKPAIDSMLIVEFETPGWTDDVIITTIMVNLGREGEEWKLGTEATVEQMARVIGSGELEVNVDPMGVRMRQKYLVEVEVQPKIR